MWRYILKRIVMIIPIVLCVTIIVFTIIYLAPGDASDLLVGTNATEAEREAVRESMGLNDPYLMQLGRYMYQMFVKHDLGTSMINKTSIAKDLAARFPYSIRLAVISIFLSVFVGIPMGIYAALHQNKLGDWIAVVIAMLGVSIPHFWLALMLVLFFTVKLNLLPAYGVGGIQYWVMPIIASGLGGIATMARQTRSSMLDVIHSDYIVTARAKGLKESEIVLFHALPNALIPIITVAGMTFGSSLGGGLILEQIFTIPGVGYYLTTGISARDYYSVMGGVLILSLAFSVIMLVTDLIQALVDPRIRAQYSGNVKRGK